MSIERKPQLLGRYLPSSSATKAIPDPTAKKSHKALTTLLTGMTKPRPTASIAAHIRPLATADMFSSLLYPLRFWLSEHTPPRAHPAQSSDRVFARDGKVDSVAFATYRRSFDAVRLS
jgi:hypothetical protein